MKLLERGMLLYNTIADESCSVPFVPNTWTTALAAYTRVVFPGLEKVIQKYNSPRVFYKENPAIAGFFSGLRFTKDECVFKLKDNVVYTCDSVKVSSTAWQKEVFFAMKLAM